LAIEGITLPGRFVARLQMNGRPMYVDPFHGGRVLSRDDLRLLGAGPALPVTAAHWLRRLLADLQQLFACQDREHDLGAMMELQRLLD